jgi:hypothetical protein
MSHTGISIKTATYGVGSTTVDVKAAVSSQVKDGIVNFTVSPTSLNVDDPAPGQIKTLNATYTINDGKTNTVSLKDGYQFLIDAPPARTASGLQITKAEYGYTGNLTDVTNAVQDLVKNGSINVKVSPSAVGIPDPNPNKKKALEVEYTINGAPNTLIITDGDTLAVSAPPSQETSRGSDFGNAGSSALYWGLWVFWIVAMILVSYKAAQQYNSTFHTIGFMALTFFTSGFFPILVLPIFIFFVRLFYDHDIFIMPSGPMNIMEKFMPAKGLT